MAKKNTSAKKKLIPAVAMLTTSAIMLSTATYAWFTMNKEVQVTGLSMSATTSDGLEISLGNFGDGNTALAANATIAAPTKTDKSWKRSIQFSDYYSTVGKLKPASSDKATTMFKVDEKSVYAGGQAVEDGATITAATQADMAKLKTKTAESTNLESSTTQDDEGYYLDVPMWIRATNNTETNIECTVTITDGKTSDPAEDLMKAVRVAILPVGQATTGDELASVAGWSTAENGVITVDAQQTTKGAIFALGETAQDTTTYPTYHTEGVISKTDNAGYGISVLAAPTLVPAASELINNTKFSNTGTKDANNAPATTVFTIPAATQNDYAGVAFVARIWIEGESTYCSDATADQDWQIDFNFKTANNG